MGGGDIWLRGGGGGGWRGGGAEGEGGVLVAWKLKPNKIKEKLSGKCGKNS